MMGSFISVVTVASPLAQEKHCHLSSDSLLSSCLTLGKLGKQCASKPIRKQQECLSQEKPTLKKRLSEIPKPENSPVILTPMSEENKSSVE